MIHRRQETQHLYEKQNLEALSLHWMFQFDNSGDEVVSENVLDMLQPHPNLKKLIINDYCGKKFPSWIENPSFSKMVTLKLIYCSNCTFLPALGRLGSLKDLSIGGMTRLERIGSEIFGKGCLKPFQSLETLHFFNLKEWEYWDISKDNEQVQIFPRLVELNIAFCPKLSGKLPDCLPSLEMLT